MAKSSLVFKHFKLKTRQVAARNKEPYYYTGTLCVNGHRSQRRTCNGNCLLCESATGSERAATAKKKLRKYHPVKALLHNAKGRARAAGAPFLISDQHLTIGEKCPCCGVTFSNGEGTGKFGSPTVPSIDKIIPSLGYVPGNVAIICVRCNTIKNDATSAELRRIADWIDEALAAGIKINP